MTIRLFSKKHNLYTNSPLWPSNQRVHSEWGVLDNGTILELTLFEDGGSSFIHHDPRNFDIEPWTGYFDRHGKKIYRGDIIKLSCFDLDYEVVWKFDRFSLKALFELYKGEIYPWPTSTDCAVNYEVTGNIHGVEYSDV